MRKRKHTPSDERREQVRLRDRIERETATRQDAWQEGSHPNLVLSCTRDLDELHDKKRSLRVHDRTLAEEQFGSDFARPLPYRGEIPGGRPDGAARKVGKQTRPWRLKAAPGGRA